MYTYPSSLSFENVWTLLGYLFLLNIFVEDFSFFCEITKNMGESQIILILFDFLQDKNHHAKSK